MDIFQNPFYLLVATTRDNRHRILELAEERSLSSDPDVCMAAGKKLTHPRDRVAAEVAWLVGVDPVRSTEVLRQLDAPNQNLLNITRLTPIVRANLLTSGLSRLSNLPSSDIVEWILTISQASEAINSETVCATLNEERRVSGFPEITDLSTIDYEIRERKKYYRQVLTSVLENLSVPERARVLTQAVESSTGVGKLRCPILIEDLILSYEPGVQDSLKQKQKIIEAQDGKLRVMVDAENPDATLQPIVDQLIQTLKEWDTIAQPIQLSKRSRGERHADSFEIAWRGRALAIHFFNEYGKLDFSLQILNTLKDVFSEVPEIVKQINEDLRELEKQRHVIIGIERFEEINAQVEKLKDASDAKQLDYTLTPMVTQLIQTIKTWNTSTQPVEANNAVAITVRNMALYLWNEHQKLDFAIQITNALIGVFKGVYGMDEVNNRLKEDIMTLYAMNIQRRRTIEPPQKRGDTGCLLQIVIFAVIGLIGALLQGC